MARTRTVGVHGMGRTVGGRERTGSPCPAFYKHEQIRSVRGPGGRGRGGVCPRVAGCRGRTGPALAAGTFPPWERSVLRFSLKSAAGKGGCGPLVPVYPSRSRQTESEPSANAGTLTGLQAYKSSVLPALLGFFFF